MNFILEELVRMLGWEITPLSHVSVRLVDGKLVNSSYDTKGLVCIDPW